MFLSLFPHLNEIVPVESSGDVLNTLYVPKITLVLEIVHFACAGAARPISQDCGDRQSGAAGAALRATGAESVRHGLA